MAELTYYNLVKSLMGSLLSDLITQGNHTLNFMINIREMPQYIYVFARKTNYDPLYSVNNRLSSI